MYSFHTSNSGGGGAMCTMGLYIILMLLCSVESATIFGSDMGGSDLMPADSDILSGTFTNVGIFTIDTATVVRVDNGVPLRVECIAATIGGILDGSASGNAGGATNPSTSEGGLTGIGPGAGEGGPFGMSLHGSGGGGAGYGSVGGNASSLELDILPPAQGGIEYGSASDSSTFMGSGGGSGANGANGFFTFGGAGGAGGASIVVVASTWLNITSSGAVLCDGEDGDQGVFDSIANVFGASGGGGGSGGTVFLQGQLDLQGLVSSNGGAGADANVLTPEFIQGGGGGAGGRIKLAGVIFSIASLDVQVNGGIAGIGYGEVGFGPFVSAQSGGDGTFFQEIFSISAVDEDSEEARVGETVTIPVLENDVSIPAGSIDVSTLTILMAPSNGVAFISGSALVYTSTMDFSGTSVSIIYQVCSETFLCDSATVTIFMINDPPEFTSVPIMVAQETYSYSISSSDPEAQIPLTVSEIVLPAWLSLSNVDTTTGQALLSGVPTSGDINQLNAVQLQLSDAYGNVVEQAFTITVLAIPTPTPTSMPTPTPTSMPTLTSTPTSTPTSTSTSMSTSTSVPVPSVTPMPSILGPVPPTQELRPPIPSQLPIVQTPAPVQASLVPAQPEQITSDTVVDTRVEIIEAGNSPTAVPVTVGGTEVVGTIRIPLDTIISSTDGMVELLIESPTDDMRATNSRDVLSVIVDLTLRDTGDGSIISRFRDNVEICLEIGVTEQESNSCADDDDSTNGGVCLATLDGDEWVCVDESLRDRGSNLVCGTTRHFSSFAVLLDGGGGGGNCESDDGYMISWKGDLALAGGITLGVIVCCLLLMVLSYTRPVRKFLYGKEGHRIESLRRSQSRGLSTVLHARSISDSPV